MTSCSFFVAVHQVLWRGLSGEGWAVYGLQTERTPGLRV